MKFALSRKNLWEISPPIIRSVVGRIASAVPKVYLLGRTFRQHLKLIHQADHWPAERARAYQLERLQNICRLAYEHTAFYRRMFDQVGFDPRNMKSLDDLSSLPTIDKHTIRDHLEDMCTVPPDSRGIDAMSTGGTEGEPLHFYIGADRSAIEYAHLVTGWERAGYRLDMPLAVFRGQVVAENRHGLRHEYDPILRHHYYGNYHMTEENMRRYMEHVRHIGPCFLHVYPSSATVLARFILRCGMTPPENIRGIIAESEIVYPEQRRAAEQVFGCRYFSCYGHSEKLVAAAECEHTSDYHLWPTYGYFELLDQQGRAITTPGQRGEIVGTGFINTVVPFIRYRTGDHATFVGERCQACGREQVIIRDIRGHRTHEALIAIDGSEISWTAVNMHDDTFMNVRQCQFYQEVPGQAILRIVPGDRFETGESKRIEEHLKRKLEGRVDFTIELTEAIPLSPRGKAIYVDQRIKSATSAEANLR